MKIADGILNCPTSGTCEINVSHVAKCFGKSFISRWHDEYRLVNIRAKVKVTISKNDAISLIEKLKLVERKSPIFNNASSWSKS